MKGDSSTAEFLMFSSDFPIVHQLDVHKLSEQQGESSPAHSAGLSPGIRKSFVTKKLKMESQSRLHKQLNASFLKNGKHASHGKGL